ncbi:MAG: LuxR C-terminal-related transcriptional regulator [Elusimicrobia bacterium]|nr:LuxR C-terminal-related transcriptional regulator [Elusimicrobiota bacterium]
MTLDDRRAALVEDRARVRKAMSFPEPGPLRLCPQERVVLGMVGAGMSDREIGEALQIRKTTVRCYLRRIHDKTAVPYRPRLAVAASRAGA